MILKVVFTIIFFLWGIVDREFAFNLIDNTIYIGAFIYLIILVTSKNKIAPTIYGYFYFLGLGASMPLIGVLPLIMLFSEYMFFLFQRFISISNKLVNFVYTGIFFSLNYLILSFIINQFKIMFSFGLLILLMIIILVGGLTSLFSKRYEG